MRNYITSIGWVAALTLTTNILGFVRELLIARAFGISFNADAFVVAFTIVSMCFLIFSAGAIQAAFMPAFQELLEHHEEGQARFLFRRTSETIGGVLLVLAVVVAANAEFWVGIALPGFTIVQVQTTATLVAIMSPMIIFVGIGNLFQAVLHAERKFTPPALVPVLINVILVGYLFVTAASATVGGLAIANVGAASLWLLILFPGVWSRLSPPLNHPSSGSFSRMLSNLWPVLILILSDQIGAVVQKTFISDLSTGSIAALNYAAKLEGLPVGIFSTAIATVYFPLLVQALSSKELGLAERRFKEGLSGIFLVSFPATVFLCCQAETVVRVLFERGAFDTHATIMTANALFYYAIGLLPQSMIVYLNRLYFSAGETRLPMQIGILSVSLHVMVCWVAVQKMGFLGIALGTTIYSIVYAILLCRFLHSIIAFKWRDLIVVGWRFAFGSAFLLILYTIVSFPSNWFGAFVAVGLGGIVYLGTLALLREPLLLSTKVIGMP